MFNSLSAKYISMGNKLYLDRQELQQFYLGIYGLKLRKMSHDQLRLMFEVMLYGALRISEVLQITPSDLISGKIRLKVTKAGLRRCKCAKWTYRPLQLVSSDPSCERCQGQGKYRIDAYAYVMPSVYDDMQTLARTKQPNERLFPIHRSRAWQIVDELLLGRTHTFRHTFLTWMLETEKFNIRDIMQKARHTNLLTTTEYIEKNADLTQQKQNQVFERI